MKFFEDNHRYIREYLVVIILYTILTVILTYPMAFHVSDTIGGGDEAFTCWSLAWTTKEIMEDPINLFHANIFYPANDYSLALSEHLIGWTPFSIPLSLITHDPVTTHNLLRLLTFVLCGFGAYLLMYRYTKNRYAAFIAGIFFAFFSYRMAIQLHLLAMEWIPFMLLFLDRFFHSVRLKDILGFTLFFLLAALSGWYVGIFAGVIVFAYFICYLILDKEVRTRIISKEGLSLLVLSIILVTLFLTPLAIPYFQASIHYDAERGLDTPLESSWSPDPVPYIQLLGYILVLFALIGFFVPEARDKKKLSLHNFITKQKIPIIFAIITLISYILMIGPAVKIGGNLTGILAPYYYIYSCFPYIAVVRDLSRFSFIMSFSVSILAGFGAAAVLTRIKEIKLNKLVATILILLAIAGSWHIPVIMPSSLATGDNIPKEYRWLAEQPEDIKIIEIPTRWVEDNSEYTYYSVYHWREMVNGYSGRDVEEASKIMRDTSNEFPSNNTISLLQRIGVKYVLVHTDRMQKSLGISDRTDFNFTADYINHLNTAIEGNFSSVVQPVISFENTYIYEINQSPEINPDTVQLIFRNGWLGSNIFVPFYLKDSGKIRVLAPDDGDYILDLITQPISGENTLSLYVNGIIAGSQKLSSGNYYELKTKIPLKKGFNEFEFDSDGCTKISDIPEMNTLSDRCISFVFGNLTLYKE